MEDHCGGLPENDPARAVSHTGRSCIEKSWIPSAALARLRGSEPGRGRGERGLRRWGDHLALGGHSVLLLDGLTRGMWQVAGVQYMTMYGVLLISSVVAAALLGGSLAVFRVRRPTIWWTIIALFFLSVLYASVTYYTDDPRTWIYTYVTSVRAVWIASLVFHVGPALGGYWAARAVVKGRQVEGT
jgi:hypothetical protein